MGESANSSDTGGHRSMRAVAGQVLNHGATWSLVVLSFPAAVVSLSVNTALEVNRFIADAMAAGDVEVQAVAAGGSPIRLNSTEAKDKEAVERLIRREDPVPVTLHFVGLDGRVICAVPISNKQMKPYAAYTSFSPYDVSSLRAGTVPPRVTLGLHEKIAMLGNVCGLPPDKIRVEHPTLFMLTPAPPTQASVDSRVMTGGAVVEKLAAPEISRV